MTRARRRTLILLILLALLVAAGLALNFGGVRPWAAGTTSPTSPGERPKAWATPIARRGLPNLHQVSPDLYRGAQPTAEGMQELKKLGVRTVLSLRPLHSDTDELADTGLAYEHISMKPWHPEDEDVVRFLRIVTDPNRTPVFVHCQYGADRTGTMCAVYRVVVQGWTKDEAVREMTAGDFGFHESWQDLIDYVNALDVPRLRRDAGLPPGP